MKKQCCHCKKEKDIKQFSIHRKDGGRHPRCNECRREYARNYYHRHRDKILKQQKWRSRIHDPDSQRLYKYGLKIGDYLQMLKEQKYSCAICFDKVKLVVDHCHDTDKVRGLLCPKCNRAIGQMNDDVSKLKNAIKYLESWPSGLRRLS